MSCTNNIAFGCGCGGLQNSVLAICGEFDSCPPNPDLGRCFPYRLKLSCAAPDLPVPGCGDYDFTIVYTPGAIPPWSVISILRDQDCNPILDEDNNQITTITT